LGTRPPPKSSKYPHIVPEPAARASLVVVRASAIEDVVAAIAPRRPSAFDDEVGASEDEDDDVPETTPSSLPRRPTARASTRRARGSDEIALRVTDVVIVLDQSAVVAHGRRAVTNE
jgi:hypothetical protein